MREKKGKRQRSMLAAVLAAALSMGILFNCLTSGAYAYLNDRISGKTETIQGANYDIRVEYIPPTADQTPEKAPDSGEAQPEAEAPNGAAERALPSESVPQAEEPSSAWVAVDGANPYHVNVTGDHLFRVTATGNASSGYCLVTVGDRTYTTEAVCPGSGMEFTVHASEGDTVAFQPIWGTPESVDLYSRKQNEGSGASLQDNEETADPTEAAAPEGTAEPEETVQPGQTAGPEDLGLPGDDQTLPTHSESTDETSPWEALPEYYQNDYPETLYGSGTVATSGCGVTALAMVGSYMTGCEYRPEELARYFGGKKSNNIDRLEYGSDKLQLVWEKSENFDFTYQALKEGKVAIALMGEKSLFTQSQHFIVLAGLTENGRILVRDPNRDNYDNPQLKNAFQNGFKKGDVQLGYSGAWIYDKSAMPDSVPKYYEPPYQRGQPRYPEITLTQEDTELLAKLVWAEARGESAEGQQAVAEVVLNRMHSDGFPSAIRDVIYGEGQFRSADKLEEAEPWQAQWEAVEKAIYGPYVLPEGVTYFATTQPNGNLWGTIGSHVFCFAPTPQAEETEPPSTGETLPLEDGAGGN